MMMMAMMRLRCMISREREMLVVVVMCVLKQVQIRMGSFQACVRIVIVSYFIFITRQTRSITFLLVLK